MHFCNKCHNMYYIQVSSNNENSLLYYCRNCGNEENLISNENLCVSKTNFTKGEQKFTHLINSYTKMDPTLPRINTIKCPNADCLSNKESNSEREVIFIRYDDEKMLYVYLCGFCDTVWKTEQND